MIEFNQRELDRLTDRLQEAYAGVVSDMNDAVFDAIESPIWDWPRITERANGTTVFSPRDVVDTGYLRDSQGVEAVSADNLNLINSAEYAPDVVFGTVQNGAIMPPRDFFTEGVSNVDLEQTFQSKFRST